MTKEAEFVPVLLSCFEDEKKYVVQKLIIIK